MWQKVSVNGVMIGAVADVIPTNIWGLAVGVYLAAKYHLNSFIYT